MLLAHVLMAGAFAWIYAFGREAKPWLAKGPTGVAVRTLAELAFTSASWK